MDVWSSAETGARQVCPYWEGESRAFPPFR